MIDLSLNSDTRRHIELSTGIPFQKIIELDALSIDKLIEKKNNKPLEIDYLPRDVRLPSRGGVYLALKRYIKMLDVDKKLNKI